MSGAIGSPPTHLGDKEKTLWKILASKSSWGDVLTVCDRDLLEQYCILSVRKAKADKAALDAEVVMGGQGPKVSPWLTISDKCWADMLKIAEQVGGTPKSRDRINTPDKPETTAGKRKRADDIGDKPQTLEQMVAGALSEAGIQ